MLEEKQSGSSFEGATFGSLQLHYHFRSRGMTVSTVYLGLGSVNSVLRSFGQKSAGIAAGAVLVLMSDL